MKCYWSSLRSEPGLLGMPLAIRRWLEIVLVRPAYGACPTHHVFALHAEHCRREQCRANRSPRAVAR